MKTALDDASTWFLESFRQEPYGRLVIRLAEACVSPQPQPIESLRGAIPGLAHRVSPAAEGRVAEVIFHDPLAFFTKRECFDAIDPQLVFEPGQTYLRRVERSSLQEYAHTATGLYGTLLEGITEFHLWTEDQVFQVFSTEEPEVTLVPGSPDLAIPRGETWQRGAPALDRGQAEAVARAMLPAPSPTAPPRSRALAIVRHLLVASAGGLVGGALAGPFGGLVPVWAFCGAMAGIIGLVVLRATRAE